MERSSGALPDATAHPQRSALWQRWLRLQTVVRCALVPERPALLRVYLGCGHLICRRGLADPAQVQQRMFEVLLQTARDEALPWAWRCMSLDHAVQPIARLSALLRRTEPARFAALEAAYEAAADALPPLPPKARAGLGDEPVV